MDSLAADLSNLGVDGRRFKTLVSKQLLNVADVSTVFQKMGGEGMPERMRGDFHFDAGKIDRNPNPTLQRARRHVPVLSMLKGREQPAITRLLITQLQQ